MQLLSLISISVRVSIIYSRLAILYLKFKWIREMSIRLKKKWPKYPFIFFHFCFDGNFQVKTIGSDLINDRDHHDS